MFGLPFPLLAVCCLAAAIGGCVTSASLSYSDGDRAAALTLYFRDDSGKSVVPSK